MVFEDFSSDFPEISAELLTPVQLKDLYNSTRRSLNKTRDPNTPQVLTCVNGRQMHFPLTSQPYHRMYIFVIQQTMIII